MFFHAGVKISFSVIKSKIDYNSRIKKSLTKKKIQMVATKRLQ